MDGFEVNKIFGAVTGTLAVFLAIHIVADGVFGVGGHHGDEKALAYSVEVAGGPVVEEEAIPLPVLLAAADMADGERGFRKCQSCHSIEPDGGVVVGPPLYGVIGRPVAGYDGFGYAGLADKAGQDWDFASMDAFLEDPKGWAPGSAMVLKTRDPEDRAALLVYLNAQSDSPLDLPVVEAVIEEAAPAAEAVDGAVEGGAVAE